MQRCVRLDDRPAVLRCSSGLQLDSHSVGSGDDCQQKLTMVKSSAYVDVMDETDAHAVVTQFLAQATGEPLRELGLAISLQKQLEVLQLQAVRNAVVAHSWSEIGSALGVTKQAAHRKFVRLLAEDVKTQKRALKQAQRAGQPAEAGAALTAALGGVEVLKQVGRRR